MQTGQRVRDYVLLNKVGDGGVGEVWTAEHTLTRSVAAIKFLIHLPVFQKEAKARFVNEARALGQMQHANIVGVFEAFEDNGTSCIVMQYVDGGSLAERLRRNLPQRLPLEEVVRISADVLAALEYLHRPLPSRASPAKSGVVHNDVKPSNILLDHTGHALLTGFGSMFTNGGHRVTQAGAMLGAAYYMSPEQIQNPGDAGASSDIYSFGCVLYEMLAGRPPFGSETDSEFGVMSLHLMEAPAPIRRWNQHVPFDFEWITYKALNKDPVKRFASGEEMSRALGKALAAHKGASGQEEFSVGREAKAGRSLRS